MRSLNASLIAFNPHQFSRDQGGGVELNPRSVGDSGPAQKKVSIGAHFSPF